MHECPFCGQVCDCDGEDTWFDAPIDCTCLCGGDDPRDDDYEDDYEDPDDYVEGNYP